MRLFSPPDNDDDEGVRERERRERERERERDYARHETRALWQRLQRREGATRFALALWSEHKSLSERQVSASVTDLRSLAVV